MFRLLERVNVTLPADINCRWSREGCRAPTATINVAVRSLASRVSDRTAFVTPI